MRRELIHGFFNYKLIDKLNLFMCATVTSNQSAENAFVSFSFNVNQNRTKGLQNREYKVTITKHRIN